MHDLKAGDLTIEVKGSAPDTLELHWRGKSNDRHPTTVLAPFFAEALAEAGKRHAAVELHFEKLAHFNSSTIAAIIQFIQEARERRVKLLIVYDSALKWQKLSFDVLKIFAKGDDLLQIQC
jgi:hypothetical protein